MKHTDPLPTSIRLAPEIKDALKRLADADERSMGNYITRVLKEHVEAQAKRQKPR